MDAHASELLVFIVFKPLKTSDTHAHRYTSKNEMGITPQIAKKYITANGHKFQTI